MLQAKLLYCLSKNKHICFLPFLSAQAQWEITDRGCQTLPKNVVKLHRSQKRFHLCLTAREILRSGASLGASFRALWRSCISIGGPCLLTSLSQTAKLNSFTNLFYFLVPQVPIQCFFLVNQTFLRDLAASSDLSFCVTYSQAEVCWTLFPFPEVSCSTSEVFYSAFSWLDWQDYHSLHGCVDYIYIA